MKLTSPQIETSQIISQQLRGRITAAGNSSMLRFLTCRSTTISHKHKVFVTCDEETCGSAFNAIS